MNTPSKEALDAAENVQDYWGFPRRATIDLATIIDRHFEPLRAEMVQLTVDRDNWKIRAEEMDGYKADCMELRQRAKQAEASNSELRESHAAIYLALATLEADCSKWPDQIRALRAVLARHAAGEPTKHPDTERLDWLDSKGCAAWQFEVDIKQRRTRYIDVLLIRDAIDAARKEV